MTDTLPLAPNAGTLLLASPRSKAVGIAERVAWTFVQAGIGSLPATVALTGHDLAAVGYSALTAGIAAVISLAKNLSLSAAVNSSGSAGTQIHIHAGTVVGANGAQDLAKMVQAELLRNQQARP